MNNFPSPPVDHQGGLQLFNFIEHSQMKSMPPIFDNTINALLNITLPWYVGSSHEDTLQLTIRQLTDNHGSPWEINLQGSVSNSPEMYKLFLNMSTRIFIAIARDTEGVNRLLGTMREPLTFSFDYASSTPSGQKALNFTFSGMQKTKPAIYALALPSISNENSSSQSTA